MQPSINLVEFYYTFWAIKVCRQHATRRSCLSLHCFLITACQLAISLKTSWSLTRTSHIPSTDEGSFRGFFLLFLFDYFGDSRNIFPNFFYFVLDQFTGEHAMIRKISERWESTENNSLVTSSSTWQTEDYFFNKKFYLKTLNPTETQWKHLLYIWSRFFTDKPKMKSLQFASKRVCSSQERSIYLITDGSMVTSCVPLYK